MFEYSDHILQLTILDDDEPAANVCLSENAVQLVKSYETCSLSAYLLLDGKYAIGYGTTLYPYNIPVMPEDSCTQQQADYFLRADMAPIVVFLTNYFSKNLAQHQLDALVSFWRSQSKNPDAISLLYMIEKYNERQKDIRSLWLQFDHIGNISNDKLAALRRAEWILFSTGIYAV